MFIMEKKLNQITHFFKNYIENTIYLIISYDKVLIHQEKST